MCGRTLAGMVARGGLGSNQYQVKPAGPPAVVPAARLGVFARAGVLDRADGRPPVSVEFATADGVEARERAWVRIKREGRAELPGWVLRRYCGIRDVDPDVAAEALRTFELVREFERDWLDGLPEVEVCLDELCSGQLHVNPAQVDAYVADPGVAVGRERPTVVRVRGLLVLEDGHHRAVADHVRGVVPRARIIE